MSDRVVADLRADAAQSSFVDSLGDPRLRAAEVDATSAEAIGTLVAGATMAVAGAPRCQDRGVPATPPTPPVRRGR